MLSQEIWENLDAILKEFWHYNDEGKAYTPETYIPFMAQFSMMRKEFHKKDKKEADDRQVQEAIQTLKELEEKLVCTMDPAALKIPIWKEGNVPDMLKNPEYQVPCDDPFQSRSLDPEGYIPGFVPYFLEDGRTHPVILVLAGGHRGNYSCGDQVCRFYNSRGYHTVLMGHRVGIQKLNYCLDLQRTVRWLRCHAEEYKIEKEHIGAIGLSFGGVVITSYIEKLRYTDRPSRYDPAYTEDAIDEESGELNAFLGIYTSSSPFLPRSNELDYSQYPPVFLALGNQDYGFQFQTGYIKDLVDNGVRVEVHAFDGAVHGFGMGDSQVRVNGVDGHIPAVALWPELSAMWLARIFESGEASADEKGGAHG